MRWVGELLTRRR